MTPDLKACLKKAKAIEKKQTAKEKKTRKKAQEQAQINDVKRLVFKNSRPPVVESFKDILSNPPAALLSSDPFEAPSSPPPIIHQTPATKQSISSMLTIRKRVRSKKKAIINKCKQCGQSTDKTDRALSVGLSEYFKHLVGQSSQHPDRRVRIGEKSQFHLKKEKKLRSFI